MASITLGTIITNQSKRDIILNDSYLKEAIPAYIHREGRKPSTNTNSSSPLVIALIKGADGDDSGKFEMETQVKNTINTFVDAVKIEKIAKSSLFSLS